MDAFQIQSALLIRNQNLYKSGLHFAFASNLDLFNNYLKPLLPTLYLVGDKGVSALVNFMAQLGFEPSS